VHAIHMDLVTAAAPTFIHIVTVIAAMKSLVTNVAATANPSVKANSCLIKS